MSCQICFEPPERLVKELCGKVCTAKICEPCLERHVEISLERSYGGMLPKIRCPICLTLMHQDMWSHQVRLDNRGTLLGKYRTLCEEACALTPPCCHKDPYTHLPEKNIDLQPTHSVLVLPSKVAEYRRRCRQFCRHKLDARAVLNYALTNFGKGNTAILIPPTLARIADPERRATLLLSYLYIEPNTFTLCCGWGICFNCKRQGHHDVCDSQHYPLDEEECLVQCRNCHAMLLKVEGCDSVQCLCGFRMQWYRELEFKKLHKQGRIPVDMFDFAIFDSWLQMRGNYNTVMNQVLQAAAERRRRDFHTWFANHKSLLLPPFLKYLWRRRYQPLCGLAPVALHTGQVVFASWYSLRSVHRGVLTEMDAKHTEIRQQRFEVWMETNTPLLAKTLLPCVWYMRHKKMFAPVKTEMFWKLYNQTHPEETAQQAEEMQEFFAIDL